MIDRIITLLGLSGSPESKTKTYAYKPVEYEIEIGKLRIVNDNTGPMTGHGTRVYLDDKEIINVVSVGFRVAVDEPIIAHIELMV